MVRAWKAYHWEIFSRAEDIIIIRRIAIENKDQEEVKVDTEMEEEEAEVDEG